MKILNKLPRFLRKWSKKKIIWTVIILFIILGIGWFLFGKPKVNSTTQVANAKKQNLEQTVLTTGQVVSGTSLNLSFQGSGIVKQVFVKEGDKVYLGQTLAYLDQASAFSSLTTAKGSLAQAKANYEKLINGASLADISVSKTALASSQVAVDNAKQNILTKVKNAYDSFYNIFANSTGTMFINSTGPNPQIFINGVSFNNQQLYSKINNERFDLNNLLSLWQNEISSASVNSNLNLLTQNSLNKLDQVNVYINDIVNLLGSYSIANTSDGQASLTTDKAIVATSLSTVNSSVSDINLALQTLQSANSALLQAQAALNLKTNPPSQADLDFTNAQILSAQGQVDLASANLNNLILRAPISGTITQVDTKIGQQASPSVEVMILQDIGSLHAEANVSEANIASLKLGQSIDYTFDALGPDKHFTGTVLTINPASIVISGVVNYKVTGSLNNVPDIKPGMTANMTILVAKKDNALAVPSSAVINKNNKQYVRVVDNSKLKTFHEVEVTTGLQADGGLVEILSGVSENQEVVTYIKP